VAEAKKHILTRAAAEALVAGAGVLFVTWALAADDAWFELHLMRFYCVTSPGVLARAHVARAIAGGIGLALVFVVRPRVGRRAERRPLRAGASFALRIAVAIALAFVAADGVLRAVRAIRPPGPPPPLVLAHRSRESAIVDTAGTPVHYAINRDGIRTRTIDDEIDPDARSIVFSGESVVLGYGLDYDETIPARVGRDLGLQPVNLGVSGSGNDEALSRLREHLPRLAHPACVVTFVVWNLIYRNVSDHRARLVLDRDGALVLAPPGSGWLHDSPLVAALGSIYHDADAIAVTRAVLRETDDLVRARGARSIFVFTQCGEARCVPAPDGGPSSLVGRIRDGLALEAIDVELDPARVQRGDIHPTAEGATAFVDAIDDAVRRAGLARE
jgi:hypothetical protein